MVDAIKEATGLTNITTQHGRAEEIKNRKFDAAVSRAVAPLKDLWGWARPLLRKPGALVCLKGGDLAAEISASGCRPKIMEIYDLFPLGYFREKYILQVSL